MRILHVVPTYLPAVRHGGPIFAVHGLARALRERGHDVSVFTTNLHGDTTLDVPAGVPQDVDGVRVSYFPFVPPRRLHRAPAMAGALAECLGGMDAVHLHSLFLWPTFAAARRAERAGVPYFVSPRGMLVKDLVRRRGRWRKEVWLRLVERRTLARATGLVVTSALEAEEARAFGLPLPPIHEISNGLDPAPFAVRPEGRLAPAVESALGRRPLLLYLGRLSWKKGIDVLIDALPQLSSAVLVLAGNDEEGLRPALEAQARQRGVTERVLFLGPVGFEDKVALLKGAAALVLPSLSENFGNVVLEAMAAGCPAVVTPEVGLAPMLEASGAGVVVPRGGFGKALAALLADPARLANLGGKGPAIVAERFAWSAIAARMEAVYRSACR